MAIDEFRKARGIKDVMNIIAETGLPLYEATWWKKGSALSKKDYHDVSKQQRQE